jgi:hypothetical protein
MFDRKYLLLAGLFTMFAQGLFAQESPEPATTSTVTTTPPSLQWSNRDMTYRGKNYDVLDSAYYSKGKRTKQFKKYLDHQEIFPPKPRNQWEIGGGLGLYNVIGSIPTLMLWQKGGGGGSINVRKSWGYIFSTRLQYIYGVAKNLDKEPTTGYGAPYTNFGYVPMDYATSATPATPIYRASRMESSQLNLDMMFNAYNINFHNARNKVSIFGYFGIGGLAYKTRMNALNSSYQPYQFLS